MVSFYTLGTVSIVGLTGCIWIYIKVKMQKYEPLKETQCYKDALAAMRSHRGAIKFLGEPIDDKKLYVTNVEKITKDIKQTEVNVEVRGPTNYGVLFFWVNQYIKNPVQAYVDEVQLQIGRDTKKRLIIKQSENKNDTLENERQ